MRRIWTRYLHLASVLVGLLGLLLVTSLRGAPMTLESAKTTRTVKVCQLLVRGAPTGAGYVNPHPWLLPMLNRSPYLPAGWVLDNPLAGAHTKDQSAYWEVRLEERHLDALAGYDLLILDGYGAGTRLMSNTDRANIRALLDRGARIWVNNSQETGTQILDDATFSPTLCFRGDPANYTDSVGRQVTMADPGHWLLNAVHPLTDTDIDQLRTNLSRQGYILGGSYGYGYAATGVYDDRQSRLHEVLRLTPADHPRGHAPLLAAGMSRRGHLVVSGTDIAGAFGAWLGGGAWAGRLDQHPTAPRGGRLDAYRQYTAAAKFLVNLLSPPADWPQAGGTPAGDRAQERGTPVAPARGWSAAFTALTDPVTSGDYLAVAGNTDGGYAASELRVYRTRAARDDGGAPLDYPYGLRDQAGTLVTAGRFALAAGETRPAGWGEFPADLAAGGEMDLCFSKPAHMWVGTPVFGQVLTRVDANTVVARTVLYALEATSIGGGDWQFRPRCFALDPYITAPTALLPQVATDLWAGLPATANTFRISTNGLPRASMTLSGRRLVITTLGKSTAASPVRIYLLDAQTGHVRAWVRPDATWTGQFRPAGPAHLISAPITFEASDNEFVQTGIPPRGAGYNPDAPRLRRETVDLLVLAGDYYPPNSTEGYPAVFYIPPTVIATTKSAVKQATAAQVRVAGGAYAAVRDLEGTALCVKAQNTSLAITFRTWDAFFDARGTSEQPYIPFPVACRVSTEAAAGGMVSETVENLVPSMGYPVLLRGTFAQSLFDTAGRPTRLTLRPVDGDVVLDGAFKRVSGDVFGHQVDAPLLVHGDQLLVSTSGPGLSFPTLASTVGQVAPAVTGGSLTALRIGHPGLSDPARGSGTVWHSRLELLGRVPGTFDRWGDAVAWRFVGDTLGPRAGLPAGYAWDGRNAPWWRTDFPFPAAAARDTVYAVGTFAGYGGYGEAGTTLTGQPPTVTRGALYALDPRPSRYLQQTVTAGHLRNIGADKYALEVEESTFLENGATRPMGALRVGARAILRVAGGVAGTPYAWDMGTIVRIDASPNTSVEHPRYWVIFDRPRPGDILVPGMADLNLNKAALLVATSTPYVSHVQSWNTVSGAEPLRKYRVTVGAAIRDAVRVGMGISPAPPANDSAVPKPGTNAEVMLSVSELGIACHDPCAVDADTHTVVPTDGPLPADWRTREYRYIPRLLQNEQITYAVEHRTGRIELNPEVAAEYADRFITVHYFTDDIVNGTPTRTRHAEIMYVPTPVKWRYEFPDAVPDGGPVVVGDTLYVPAIRHTNDGKWQPSLYAFALAPANPRQVGPLWVQAIGAGVADTADLPYRAITTPAPSAAGMAVGTALPVRTAAVTDAVSQAPLAGRTFTVDSVADLVNLTGATRCDVARVRDEGKWYVLSAADPTVATHWREQVYRAAANEAAMLNPAALVGDLAYRQDLGRAFILTALPGSDRRSWALLPGNELAFLADRWWLVGDGQRLLRVSADGRLGWQALGTANPDPRAVATGNPGLIAAAVQEQAFVLVTRVRRLPNGNILVCDTGANRIVEMDRRGNTVWQYPDSDLLYLDPDRAADGTDLRGGTSAVTLAQIRKPTAAADRINGPRDVRRYIHDKAIPAGDPHVDVDWLPAAGNPVDLRPFGVTLRWESTLIADSGNNRVIEVRRPLVRIDNVDGLNQATGVTFAPGFQYRPDVRVTFDRADNGTEETLPAGQTTSVLVGDSIVLKLDGVPYTKPLSMVAALRYSGPDGHLRSVYEEEQATGANYHNPMNGALTRELLCAVGNTVADPYHPAQMLRTVRISAKTPSSIGAVIRNYASLVADAGVGDTQVKVDYSSEFKVGDEVTISYADPVNGPVSEKRTIAALTPNGYVGGVPAPATVTFTAPLAHAYPMPADAQQSPPRITARRANALALRPDHPDDYARVWQLDQVELRRQGSQGADEVHLLVVDASGVREVPADPARQTTPVFHMEQDEYEQAVRNFRSTIANAANWTAIANRRLAGLSGEEQAARQQTGLAWSSDKDMLFAPVALVRIDPSNGLIPEKDIDRPAYERGVRYIISQMNTTPSADPAARINGKSVPRTHLVEARFVNSMWAFIDNDLDYFAFPDPLGAHFPALPGGGYPLTQPLCVTAD